MTPASGGLIPAGTQVRLGDGHGGWTTAGVLALPVELHYADPAGDDELLAAMTRALLEPITVTVPMTCLPSPLLALLTGWHDQATADAAAVGAWESEGGALR